MDGKFENIAGQESCAGTASREWVLDYPAGLHARPATLWVKAAKNSPLPLQICFADKSADPRNLIALLQLGLKEGSRISVGASGVDAEKAVDAFIDAIAALSAEEKQVAAKAAARAAARKAPGWRPPESGKMEPLSGVTASPGFAVGPAFIIDTAEPDIPDLPEPPAQAQAALDAALTQAGQALQALAAEATARLGEADAGIFRAQAELLSDRELLDRVKQTIAKGHGAAWAWHAVLEQQAGQLAGQENALLAARAADLRDVGRRVLKILLPDLHLGGLTDLPAKPCVLIARDLAPSDTAGLNPAQVAALVTAEGGPTSHTAILARTLDIPAVVAAGGEVLSIPVGQNIIVDADSGRVWPEPTEQALAEAEKWLEKHRLNRAGQIAERGQPARTTDGTRLEIAANINRPEQVPPALDLGAEGVGLMRTEFLFLERDSAPSEAEQYAVYKSMAEALHGKPLLIRALDIGGDKQVPYLNLPKEDNPFLGVRGARLLLKYNELFEPQMRAIYRAAKDCPGISVMFPMIADSRELVALRERCEALRLALDAPVLPLGIMVEVPSAALLAEALAAQADFFSIGTNDLTQYALAMDRQHPELAKDADSLHPAVLKLIAGTVKGAAAHQRWVGVCGGLAGDPLGAAILTGLGVNELSMSPRDVPAVKAMIRKHSLDKFKALAAKALTCSGAAEVRSLAGEL